MGKLTLSIFGYTNYRRFLLDFYESRKKEAHGYSYRQFGSKAGMTSPNALKNVIENKANLTPQATEKFLVALGLSGSEASYFRCLVLMNQAVQTKDKERYFTELQELTPNANRYELQGDALEYIQHWIYPMIRELIQVKGFRDDPYWIKRRLTSNVDLSDIAKALLFL